MNPRSVKLGIVGLGNMGTAHANTLLQGVIPNCKLTAICDACDNALTSFDGVRKYKSFQTMLASDDIEAVLISTPHYSHTTLGIEALNAGLHVLVEKPISAQKKDCESLIAAHKNDETVFAAMFNQRTHPHYIKLKQLIDSGQLGKIHRINWIITDWFRSEAYYASGDWRATWKGEGGGVLLNQCPHQLDLWQWLFGMPKKVRAFCHMGKFHDIEVEDDVTAYLEYENGTTGVFITTTGEAPGTNRLEVAVDFGRIILENGKIQWTRNAVKTTEFLQSSPAPFGGPEVWNIEIPVTGKASQHAGIIANFAEAILEKKPLIAPAAEGTASVELANAMLYSSETNQTVTLPLNANDYGDFLNEKIARSSHVKKTQTLSIQNLNDSF